MAMSKRAQFLNTTWNGKKLLEKHKLDETGLWEVRGEDPNCDLGGSHHEPVLGHLQGTLSDVVDVAVRLGGFWVWGSGGRITKITPIKAADAGRDAIKRAKLEEQIADLQRQLADLDDVGYTRHDPDF